MRGIPGFLIVILFSCTVSKVKHNESVTQEIIARKSDSVVVKAGTLYEGGKFKRFLLGDHYRDVWLAPVTVPVLNFDTVNGGLTILERGGGMQTYSLKLKGGDGRLYSLRSIQKDPTPLLPFPLRFSFADDILQDQISASHPYGAFILPALGDAAGIYHTNPELFYVPDIPELGKYRKDFGGMLAMLEEDADEDWSGYEDFGGTENAVSTSTLRESLRDDHDNAVDQKSFLRVRLFDMWLGDIDRHEGQFRWAEFEHEDGKLYKPIPEDRDNVFFRFDGVLPWLVNRKWALRKVEDFQPEVADIAGLNYSARYIDRRFLTDLSGNDWVAMASDLQERLTDDVIKTAIRDLPDTVFQLSGARLINVLKIRRDKLKQFALAYYKILAREVNVIGSDKNDYFEAIRKPDGRTEVNVYEASDEGERERRFYHRVFHPEETREIRWYGLEGEDFFFVSGKADEGILLRIIGGEDKDTFEDSSKVKGLKRKTIYYDEKKETDLEEGNDINGGKESKIILSSNPAYYAYNFRAFKYDDFSPALYVGLNSDDGIFFGGGVIIKTHGFKKEPHSTYQRIVANFAPETAAWNLQYEGDFVDVIGALDFNAGLLVRAPNYFTNFYGYGNETAALVDDDDFYRVRYQEVQFFPGFDLDVGDNTNIKFGPFYHYASVNEDQYIDKLAPGIREDIFAPGHFTGFAFDAIVSTTDNTYKPERGIKWLTEIQWLAELNNDNSYLSRLESALSFYYTLDIPFETTFAVRLGGASISGDYNFYQAATIGGHAGLSRHGTVRGYGRNRFAGRSSIYQNNEVRISLLKIPFYYMPFEFGISAHFDQGRVWADGENSDEWHTGAGGGFWIAPLGRWVFTAVYTRGEEEGRYNLNLGFMF